MSALVHPISDVSLETPRRRAADPQTSVARRAAVMAAREMMPIATGMVPFAVVVSVAIDASPMHVLAGWIVSGLVYGGSAQLAAMGALAEGAGPLAALSAGVLVSLRLSAYGAALADRFAAHGRRFRWLAPHLIVDHMYALVSAHDDETDPAWFRAYWLTAGAITAVSWLGTIAVGLALGDAVPTTDALELVHPLAFLGLLLPRLRERPGLAAAAVGGAVALVAQGLPNGLGLIVAAVAGAAVATRIDRSTR